MELDMKVKSVQSVATRFRECALRLVPRCLVDAILIGGCVYNNVWIKYVIRIREFQGLPFLPLPGG